MKKLPNYQSVLIMAGLVRGKVVLAAEEKLQWLIDSLPTTWVYWHYCSFSSTSMPFRSLQDYISPPFPWTTLWSGLRQPAKYNPWLGVWARCPSHSNLHLVTLSVAVSWSPHLLLISHMLRPLLLLEMPRMVLISLWWNEFSFQMFSKKNPTFRAIQQYGEDTRLVNHPLNFPGQVLI